ncbi:GntR family transcriptional regulator [Nocardia sp. NPDC052566]|uniref:GntR family transcriptional regulator n=1 Tax=Nocardia sp. NPDC052566 TaxID=3364330 RepID=UPI0037C9473A
MAEPAYVSIAGEYARQIRGGDLAPGTQLRSYAELAERHGVSQIVIRKAIELLLSQGLVRTVERRGTFVADRPNLVRVSPERQMESPEMTYSRETDREVSIERDTQHIPASPELAEVFGIATGDELTHVITLATEGGRPISISDTYQPLGVHGTTDAVLLEETIADRIPPLAHGEWLGVASGDLVKAVHQRFLTKDDRVLMISDVSYPRDRYEAFVFRMRLDLDIEPVTPSAD